MKTLQENLALCENHGVSCLLNSSGKYVIWLCITAASFLGVDEYAFVLNLSLLTLRRSTGMRVLLPKRRYSLDTVYFMKHGKLTILSTSKLKFNFHIFHCIGKLNFEFD